MKILIDCWSLRQHRTSACFCFVHFSGQVYKMAVSFNGIEIPQYTKDIPLELSAEHLQDLVKRSNHNNDPLGDIYDKSRYKTSVPSAPIIQEMDIPTEITDNILSFLSCSYLESTMDCPRNKYWFHSDPTIDYGSEAMLLFTPPKATKLPSDSYTLDKVRYKLGTDDGNDKDIPPSRGKIFVGIQVFDVENIKKPGEGEMIYANTLEINEDDTEFMVQPGVDLKCGQMYIFWATLIEGSFQSALVNGTDDIPIESRESCKISNCNLNYYAARQNQNEYRLRYDFMTCYEASFSYYM